MKWKSKSWISTIIKYILPSFLWSFRFMIYPWVKNIFTKEKQKIKHTRKKLITVVFIFIILKNNLTLLF